MKPFYWCCYSLAKTYSRLMYRHRVYGLENIPQGAAIIAPNHTSFIDPPLVGISFPDEVHFLAKASLFDYYLFSWMIRNLQAHPILGSSTQDLNSMKLIINLLKDNNKVVIFPEGNRSEDGQLTSIKSGIGMLGMRARVPIIPVYVHGAFEVWPRHQSLPKLCGKTACVIGKPINWEEFQGKDRKESQQAFSNAVTESIERLRKWYLDGAKGNPT